MGTFQGGRWFILLFLFLFIQFLFVFCVVGVKAYYHHTVSTDANVDSGVSKASLDMAYRYGGKCIGPSNLDWHETGTTDDACYLKCTDFKDPAECEKRFNCTWRNTTFIWFIDTSKCDTDNEPTSPVNWHAVNLSYYGYSDNNFNSWELQNLSIFTHCGWDNICENTGVTYTQYRCELFGCVWVNASQLTTANFEVDISRPFNLLYVMKESITVMLGAHSEMGFGNYNWIYTSILVYPFIIMLLYSFYMMIRGA